MRKTLRIVSISAEVDPYSKTGGLADVCRSLPKALKRLGHQIIIITPFYKSINPLKHNLKLLFNDVTLLLDQEQSLKVNYWQGELMKRLPIYFVEEPKYLSSYKDIYGSPYDNTRFFVFDLASLKLLTILKFEADIIHCHDWHTGLCPYFLKKDFKDSDTLKNVAVLFTIHNLSFQLGHAWREIPKEQRDDGNSVLPPFQDSQAVEKINFVKRAIIHSDIINTVSEQYAQEILTKDFGEDLDRILQKRKDRFFGIINGIDYKDYNPATDSHIFKNYNLDTLEHKKENKLFLEKQYGLPQNKDIPLISMVSRITEQKGFDLIIEIIETVLKLDLQLIVMGSGEKKYEGFFQKVAKKFSTKIAVYLEFDQSKATQFYAGSDMFLMPSRFEPCGLGQLISLRYGTIPIVRATGGLLDTITDFNPQTGHGNGFVFHRYHPMDLLIAITRALETYKYKESWHKLMVNGMRISFSWKLPAKKYVVLYRRAMKRKQTNQL